MAPIDLRSDTVTTPGPAMRDAMASAAVGDDVYREDPTVNALEERAAAHLGKEDALLVPSGTMGNLIALLTVASAGEEVIADAQSHVLLFEGAGAAGIGGIQLWPVATEAGVMTPEQIGAAIRPHGDDHQPRTAALAIENTHNRHGGAVWSLDALDAATNVARERGLAVHLDGARIFNAALATGVQPARLAAGADSVMFCLSKGLGCPGGSVLCGSRAFIARARRTRKILGGGMRQVGVLAACGLYAFDHMIERLAEDHTNAQRLAQGLAEVPGIDCDPARVATNIAIAAVPDRKRFVEGCLAQGLLVSPSSGERVRFVTHDGITSADIDRALAIAADVAQRIVATSREETVVASEL
jgi:threonine aldolase